MLQEESSVFLLLFFTDAISFNFTAVIHFDMQMNRTSPLEMEWDA